MRVVLNLCLSLVRTGLTGLYSQSPVYDQGAVSCDTDSPLTFDKILACLTSVKFISVTFIIIIIKRLFLNVIFSLFIGYGHDF